MWLNGHPLPSRPRRACSGMLRRITRGAFCSSYACAARSSAAVVSFPVQATDSAPAVKAGTIVGKWLAAADNSSNWEGQLLDISRAMTHGAAVLLAVFVCSIVAQAEEGVPPSDRTPQEQR